MRGQGPFMGWSQEATQQLGQVYRGGRGSGGLMRVHKSSDTVLECSGHGWAGTDVRVRWQAEGWVDMSE